MLVGRVWHRIGVCVEIVLVVGLCNVMDDDDDDDAGGTCCGTGEGEEDR
jgi:hypothetical protein